jgi:CubicO group peptidase (beta-lactamase class C family)
MAKIGLLCLNEGVWHGARIISSEWIQKSTQVHYVCDGAFQNLKYGFLWWIIDPEKHLYAAIGNSGNVIYIDPIHQIVVAIAATFKPTVFDRIDFIRNDVIPFLIGLA